jgi:hypothetical protein
MASDGMVRAGAGEGGTGVAGLAPAEMLRGEWAFEVVRA